ncbi:MAG: hypothetical protein K2K82_03865 [Muribaculaceae bacterium]|nr:hypothetical protein [Muribaculaceae bacterium]
MKRIISTILTAVILLTSPLTMDAKKPVDKQKAMKEWANYEATTQSVGQNGTKSLKVWGFGKKVDKAIEQAKKNAVHACLFKGVPGNSNAMKTPAIFANQGNILVLDENFEYFYDFFNENGDYLNYVNITTDGYPSGQDRREVKGGYKVAVNVQVMYDNLKQRMKDDGILKSAADRFTY